MDPVGSLYPQPWMTAPETVAVFAALTAEGGEARFVGGCVRDALLQRPVSDIDIATPEPPENVLALLAKAGIRAIPTGIEHGTVTAVIGKAHFEITTLRRDVETDGRRARVAFTDDWTADAARRDFTINALSCTLDGSIYDPYEGLEDLHTCTIRFVGEPMERIREDVLRILRFFRFYAHYGAPPPNIVALAACRAMAGELVRLSGERVCGELFKLLLAREPAATVVLMRGERVLDAILPEARNFGALRVVAWLEGSALAMPNVHPDALRRLAALVEVTSSEAEALALRLKLSRKQGERLALMTNPPITVSPFDGRRATRRHLHHVGAARFRDLVLLSWARCKALEARQPANVTQGYRALLEAADSWEPQHFPLKGRDVLDFNVKPGPDVGLLLAEIEQWWEQGDFRADRQACIERLGGLLLLRHDER